jgi:hypothetical protein
VERDPDDRLDTDGGSDVEDPSDTHDPGVGDPPDVNVGAQPHDDSDPINPETHSGDRDLCPDEPLGSFDPRTCGPLTTSPQR